MSGASLTHRPVPRTGAGGNITMGDSEFPATESARGRADRARKRNGGMMRKTPISGMLVAALLAGCAGSGGLSSVHGHPDAAVREAVLRYQFDHVPPLTGGPAKVYFIRVSGHDPSAGFLARFKDHDPPVRPASAARTNGPGGVVGRAHGKPGILFQVGRVRWLDSRHAEVTGGFVERRRATSGDIYRVTRNGKRWVVTGDLMRQIQSGEKR